MAAEEPGIVAWDAKRAYNTSRPITAIRALYAGKQIAGFAGPGAGIHFQTGDLISRALGQQVGALVYRKALSYINETSFRF